MLLALFVTLYTAIERLLACADESESSSESALARCVLLRDLCPALQAIMSDGMKPEVITSFGRMPTSVWQVVEAVTRQVYPYPILVSVRSINTMSICYL